ncbi:MAG: glycosyltransferase [Planctomycetaceae bacterium]
MSLTVVQLLPQLDAGGVERGTLEINRALVAAGHRSIVISGGGRLEDQLVREGGEHVRMAVWKKSPWTLATAPKLRRWIQDVQPDIVHARSRVPAWVTWLAWRKLPVSSRPKFITTAHGMNRPNIYSRIMTRGERVIAVSRTCRDFLLKNYPETDPQKVTVIHRGVDPTEFPYGYQPSADWLADWYRNYPELKGRFVACLPGRVTRFKGHLDFLQAIADVRAQGLPISGVIAGAEDPRRRAYSAELRKRIQELKLEQSVVFTGHRSDVRDVICACDVTVSTSIQPPESFGRAVLESIRLGRVTLGYDHGGVGEVLGTVYPEGRIPLRDVRTLAARLLAAANGSLKAPLPNTEFLLSTMQQRELALYEELCGVPSTDRQAA